MKSVAVLAIIWQLTAVSYAEDKKQFSNTWVAEINGSPFVASQVAKKGGFSYKGLVLGFENYYALIKKDLPVVMNWPNVEITQRLRSFPEVKWAEQQELMKVSLDYSIKKRSNDVEIQSSDIPNKNLGRETDDLPKCYNLTGEVKDMFDDYFWNCQWYMNDVGGYNLNVLPVYKKNITGKNIVIAVIDTGVKTNHPDLEDNVLAEESYDLILNKTGSEPVKTSGGEYSHGTMSAGVIAMVANDGFGGVGVAYNSKIIGVRAITKKARVMDVTLAQALKYKIEKVDIYSNSWSLSGNGIEMQYITTMIAKALKEGAEKGREGKGSIYVFAAGNDKREKHDNCASDAYVNNVYTIPIASASRKGKTIYYSERCPGVFATAFSGVGNDNGIVSTVEEDLHTRGFGGTSASVALASGVIALALEANPKLTSRDVMHLITMSSEVTPLKNNDGIWYRNARGFWVSNDFGFGLLNAGKMVELAKNWKTVPERKVCEMGLETRSHVYWGETDKTKITVNVNTCKNKIMFLEQLEVITTIKCSRRGALNLAITSPSGTKTVLMETRTKDENQNYNNWSIRSLHTWGENPNGDWNLEVRLDPSISQELVAVVKEVKLKFHGTSTTPYHYADLPRNY